MSDSTGSQSDTQSSEWTGGSSSAVSRWLANRSASVQAAFLLPYLRPGMELLDCGCGPGSITEGLARIVAPGQVVGIDFDASKVEQARELAAARGTHNLRFETADIHKLPFADGSFDVVYSNAVLTYSRQPLAALVEMRRVLKRGGILGLRTVDFDGHLFTPSSPLLLRFFELWDRQGDDAYLGKHLRGLFRQAGFVNVRTSATYECYGGDGMARSWGKVVAELLHEDAVFNRFLEYMERAEIEKMREEWLQWGQNPDAFFADSFCEAVGWKE